MLKTTSPGPQTGAADLAAALPFDTDAIVGGLEPWVRCESPSYDGAAVGRMIDMVAREVAELGAQIEIIPGRDGLGPSLRAQLPHADFGKPGILVSGHFDTVHPVGTLAKNPFRREGDKVFGPGIMDMKAGNYLAVEALRQIQRAHATPPLPVTLLFTPDEEIGSPTSRALIEAQARRNRFVLCPEPALPNNGVSTGRYAIARYKIATRGAPSHAGIRPADGVSALRELCHRVIEIEALSGSGCTYSVNGISSGQWVNCVPDHASAEVLSMAKTDEDLARGTAALRAMAGTRNGVVFEVEESVLRPVWENGRPETMALYAVAEEIATQLGQTIYSTSSGGGSDANFSGAMGIPSLCSLGVAGQGMHTLEEHIDVTSLIPRARLLAGLFLGLK